MTTIDLSNIVITATSAVTAVGANTLQTCAAIKARITPFVEHAYITCTPDDPEWDDSLPTYVATVPFISPVLNTIERFTQLAIPALTELFANSKLKRVDLGKTVLLIALPLVDKSVQHLALNDSWIANLQKETGLGGLSQIRIVRSGHVGVFSLMNEAIELLNHGDVEQCIIGGVDSYLLEERIAHLDLHWRVKSERNVDGFIPGEAAAMLLLERHSNGLSRGVKSKATIVSMGTGNEINSFHSQLTSTGVGLGDAIKTALSEAVQAKPIDAIYCDFNGESYFAHEWGLMRNRLAQVFNQAKTFNHPAECYGDVGAATGALLVVNAIESMNAPKENINTTLLATVNDDGLHRTLLLTK